VAFVAVTVTMDELPAVIEVGFAAMLTVGAGFGVTVTVAFAVTFPPAPVAVAVYVVVAVGLTDCVPPFGCKVYVLPSDPLTVTCVAFAAVTVKMEEPPGAIDAGLALMLTVGGVTAGGTTVTVAVAEAVVPAVPVATAE